MLVSGPPTASQRRGGPSTWHMVAAWSIPVSSRGPRLSGWRTWPQRIGAQLGPGADPGAADPTTCRPLAEPGRRRSVVPRQPQVSATAGVDTRAAACLVAPAFAARVPADTAALITAAPYRGFALALQHFYPDAMHAEGGDGGRAAIRRSIPRARLEEGVVVEPGAVDRARGPDRARHAHRGGRAGRLSGDHRPRQLHRPRRDA